MTSTGPTATDTGITDRHRDVWAIVNEQFTDGDAEARWAEDGVRWGLFRRAEAELRVLGDIGGVDVVELACGTAFLSAALCRAGARPVGVDISHEQLLTALRCQEESGVRFPLVEATGERVPLRDGCCDLVVSEHGAAPWCDPGAWLGEAARLLRPGGRLVFLTHSPISAMCVPADGGVAGDRLLRGQRDLRRVDWPGGGVEHHPGHGEWVALLAGAGFDLDALHELYVADDTVGTGHFEIVAHFEIVTTDWARRWPAEDLWVARRR